MGIDFYVVRSFYILTLFGIFLIFKDSITYLVRGLLWPIRKVYGGKKSMLEWHIESILLVISNGKNVEMKVKLFALLVITTFITSSVIFVHAFKIKGILLALILSAMPYIAIRARLYVKQVKSSFEGEMLMEELVNQYKMCNRNIYETLDASILSIPEGYISKNALYQLRLKLTTFRSEDELKKALQRFVLNWNSTWSKMIADNIYNAVWERIDVLTGFENLLEECKNINKGIEINKRESLEAELIAKVICPLFFIILMCAVRFMFGYSWEKIFAYLFIDKKGVSASTLLLFVYNFNVSTFPVLGKRNYDF